MLFVFIFYQLQIFQLEGASQPAVDRKLRRKPFEHPSFTTSNLTRPGSAWASTTGKSNFCASFLISHISEDTALIFIKSSLYVPWRRELHFEFWGLIPKRLFYGLKFRFYSDSEGTWMDRWCVTKLLVSKGMEVFEGLDLPTTRARTALRAGVRGARKPGGMWGPLARTGGVVAGSGMVKVWSTHWDPVLKKLTQMTASWSRARSSRGRTTCWWASQRCSWTAGT